jgi:hypothetical protein
MTTHERKEIQREIREYLIENPDSKDTLEGIARFWIARHRVSVLLRDIESVLAGMVERGDLERRMLQTGEQCYQLNPIESRKSKKRLSPLKKPRRPG